MNGSDSRSGRSAVCAQAREQFQSYVDGDLERERGLELFLHVRDCEDCRAELDAHKRLVAALTSLRTPAVPADFDARVLANVPYAAYRALEPLRRARVPVYLEESFLPAAVRAPVTRIGGLVVAASLAVGLALGAVPEVSAVPMGLALLPEALVRAQRLGRRLRPALERTGGG